MCNINIKFIEKELSAEYTERYTIVKFFSINVYCSKK